MIGSCLMMGLKGFQLSKEEKEFLISHNIAGVILFKRNIQSFEQVYDLCYELKSLAKPPLLIAVDMEGGDVNRFAHLKSWPSPKVLRRLTTNQISDIAFSMAKQLSLLGIDVNFAPVVDLLEVKNPLLENRVLGKTKDEVIRSAGAFLKGFIKGGGIPCLKHFPGHGSVTEDSHKTLPKDFRSLKELEAQLEIFQVLFQRYPCWIMTAHIEFLKIDNRPASFSSFFLQKELKIHRSFKGLVVSDDIDMEALKAFSFGERFFYAIQAGCHLVLTCQKNMAGQEIIEYFKQNPTYQDKIKVNLQKASNFLFNIRKKCHKKFLKFKDIEKELHQLPNPLNFNWQKR